MPNQPLPASPYIDIFYTSNNRDKGEELKAPFESALFAFRIPFTRYSHLLFYFFTTPPVKYNPIAANTG